MQATIQQNPQHLTLLHDGPEEADLTKATEGALDLVVQRFAARGP